MILIRSPGRISGNDPNDLTPPHHCNGARRIVFRFAGTVLTSILKRIFH